MTYSRLTNSVILTDKCNDRKGNPICKITPHHMAGIMSGQSCAHYFVDTSHECSANYCIGVDGDIACNVEEENRAWTSSSWDNDKKAITIEVSDCDENYNISDASWTALVNLCVDICKRYGFDLNYTGDADGSLTEHRMFADTQCPGEPFHSRFQELADTVNKMLHEGITPVDGAMYRLYNANNGEHFYTEDIDEANKCVDDGLSYEGIAWMDYGESGIPLFRLFNPNSGLHHYTTGTEERNKLVSEGWNLEGVAGRVAPYSTQTAIWCAYNPNDGNHFFTENNEEYVHAVDVGWSADRGIAFYD